MPAGGRLHKKGRISAIFHEGEFLMAAAQLRNDILIVRERVNKKK
jgi:hypothetical protein